MTTDTDMKRHRSFFVLNLIAAFFLLLSGCQANRLAASEDIPAETQPRINPVESLPENLDAFPHIVDRNSKVPEDYEAVAENDILRLYVRRASSAIIVEDKRSGHLWRSSPEGLSENTGTTTAWRKQIEIPIQVAYVDPERAQPKIAKTDREFSLVFQPVQNGVQVLYNFEALQLAFGVDYTLRDDCLEATIPDATVSETGANGLATVDLLAFLGATQDGEEGYIVYPDGSGALMHFNSPHPPDVQKILTVIYGSDASGGIIGSTTGTFREQISMPVFGLVTGSGADSSAFVGMITQGDFDASLGVARSGKGINYNHVWTTLTYRRQGRFSITGGQPAWLYQPDRITGNRSIRYCFLNGEDANYAGMAARYREYLVKERGAVRASSRPGGDNPPLMHLGFIMGTERKTWFLADRVLMTTFNQANDILKDLEGAGVKRLDVSLWMWNKGGMAYKYPQRFPVEERLGGEKALTGLSEEIHRRGQRLFLQDDYLSAAPGANGVTPYLDAIRGVDGLPVGNAEQGYLINPQVALRSFASRDIPKMKALGADGLVLQNFGFLALPDKNTRYPLSRESFAATWMQLANFARKQLGRVAVEGGNTYTIPYTDRMDFVSVDSTHFDFFDETIPFYQIAVHGLTPYSNNPYNLISDGRRIFLRQIEYGAMPLFVLTQSSSAELFRTNLQGVYSSQYSFWRNEVISQYKVMEQLAPLSTQFITGHERLAAGVYQTTYEDGSRVIVNYGPGAYTVGKVSVPAKDFSVITP